MCQGSSFKQYFHSLKKLVNQFGIGTMQISGKVKFICAGNPNCHP